jgi:cullin 3
MIDSRQEGALARLYKLFVMVPAGLGTLKKALRDSIAARGKHVNDAGGNDADPDVDVVQVEEELYQGKGKGKAKPPQAVPPGRKTLDIALKWVQDVLDLKDLFDRILKTSFLDDKGIQASLNEVGGTFSSCFFTNLKVLLGI